MPGAAKAKHKASGRKEAARIVFISSSETPIMGLPGGCVKRFPGTEATLYNSLTWMRISRDQRRKWRTPVKTMAMPSLLAGIHQFAIPNSWVKGRLVRNALVVGQCNSAIES